MLEGSARRKGQRRVALLCGHFGYSKQAYSRRIMGWFVHDKLNTEGPLNALYRAFLQVRASEIGAAYEKALEKKGSGMLFCVGSLYLAGELKAYLAKRNG